MVLSLLNCIGSGPILLWNFENRPEFEKAFTLNCSLTHTFGTSYRNNKNIHCWNKLIIKCSEVCNINL